MRCPRGAARHVTYTAVVELGPRQRQACYATTTVAATVVVVSVRQAELPDDEPRGQVQLLHR